MRSRTGDGVLTFCASQGRSIIPIHETPYLHAMTAATEHALPTTLHGMKEKVVFSMICEENTLRKRQIR
jgi:hypothetical protein